MNEKKVTYLVLIVILFGLGIIIYRLNFTKIVSRGPLVQVDEINNNAEKNLIISAFTTTPMGPTSSMISWKTDQLTTTEVYYSLTSLSGTGNKWVVKDPTLASSHTIEITHLIPGTKYYFIILSANKENTATSTRKGEFITATI